MLTPAAHSCGPPLWPTTVLLVVLVAASQGEAAGGSPRSSWAPWSPCTRASWLCSRSSQRRPPPGCSTSLEASGLCQHPPYKGGWLDTVCMSHSAIRNTLFWFRRRTIKILYQIYSKDVFNICFERQTEEQKLLTGSVFESGRRVDDDIQEAVQTGRLFVWGGRESFMGHISQERKTVSNTKDWTKTNDHRFPQRSVCSITNSSVSQTM